MTLGDGGGAGDDDFGWCGGGSDGDDIFDDCGDDD